MIRIVCKEMDASSVVHAGAAKPYEVIKTFDLEAPSLEEWITKQGGYNERSIIGVEILERKP